jgi:hypothetical protein
MRWLGWGGWWRPNDLYELLAQGRFWVLLVFVSSYLLVPVIGMHQSMVRKHFMVSWLTTLALGLILPLAMALAALIVFTFPLLLGGLPWSPEMASSIRFLAVLAIAPQIFFAARAASNLYQNLEQRSFALGRE